MAKGQDPQSDRVAQDLARHILPTSGTMVGICTTLVGLVKIAEGRSGPSNVDVYGAIIGMLFLASAVLSYMSIRTGPTDPQFSRRSERVADGFFLGGLFCIVSLMALFAFEAV